jgi:16S rRNA U516 pseudouridylate synthase RsuA-like enzyme
MGFQTVLFRSQVSRLIRTAYGPLALDGLGPGQVEEVDAADLDAFRKSLK